jgi:hypothetical protein
MMTVAYQALGPEQPQAMRARPCVPCRLMPRERLPPKEPALSVTSGLTAVAMHRSQRHDFRQRGCDS